MNSRHTNSKILWQRFWNQNLVPKTLNSFINAQFWKHCIHAFTTCKRPVPAPHMHLSPLLSTRLMMRDTMYKVYDNSRKLFEISEGEGDGVMGAWSGWGHHPPCVLRPLATSSRRWTWLGDRNTFKVPRKHSMSTWNEHIAAVTLINSYTTFFTPPLWSRHCQSSANLQLHF